MTRIRPGYDWGDRSPRWAGVTSVHGHSMGGLVRVIPRRLISEVEFAHPSWSSRTIDGIGHLLPGEAPDAYVELAA
jgi:hypothetical protein